MNRVYLAYIPFGETLHVLGSPDGTLEHLRPVGVFTPDWTEVHGAADAIRSLVHHAAEAGEFAVASLGELRLRSTYLFDELVPFDVKRWLRAEPGALSLNLAPELLNLPWELLHDGASHLCLRWSMGRLVQHAVEPGSARPLDGADERSVLVIADPDGELHHCYDEGMVLREQLKQTMPARVTFRAGDVDAAFVRHHAREFDVLHYAGHIDLDGWRMSESRFDADALERLTGGAPLPALVFANGCGATRIDDWDRSMLHGWLASGVRHYVGPLFDLPDRLGGAFARHFYQALASGAPVGDAIRDSRRALAARYGDGTTPWGSYVLYGDPATRYAATAEEQARTSSAQPRPARPTVLRTPGEVPASEVVRRTPQADETIDVPRFLPSGPTISFAAILVLIVIVTLAFAALVRGGIGHAWNEIEEPAVEAEDG